MTVWYVRRDYVFRVNSHCVGEMFSTQSQMWISHFPSYLVIDLFHRRCFDDYFLLVCPLFCVLVKFLLLVIMLSLVVTGQAQGKDELKRRRIHA